MTPSHQHTKQYSAEDFERYYSGKMPAEEMHALEKAALDDPFLADALEGYAQKPESMTEVEQLHQRVGERINKKDDKSRFILFRNWLQIAALLLLLAGAGWFIYKSSFPKHSIAKSEEQVNAPTDTLLKKPVAVPDIDTTSQLEAVQQPIVKREQKKTGQFTKRNNQSVKEKETLARNNNAPMNTEAAKQDQPPATTNFITEHYTEPGKPSAKKAPLTNTIQKPLSLALQSTKDSTGDTALANTGAKAKTTGDTVQNINVMLKPLPHSTLDEIVVSEYRKKKKQELHSITIVDSLEPFGGWNNFDDYISENIKIPDQIQEKPIPGEVELSFEVDKYGNPVHIKVEKSLCNQCDEEAIRLLTQGPKWKKKKNRKKARLRIHF